MAISTRFPTTNAAYSGAGFTNPSNLHVDDGVYGTSAPAKNNGLGTAYGTFGFDAAIPAGSTIDAVKILYEFKVSTTSSVAIQRTKARIATVEQAAHDNTTEPLTDTPVTVDITADRAWTRDNLLDANFEIIAEPRRGNNNTAYTASWDYVKVEVTYTEPSVTPTRGQVSWTELETPFVQTRGLVSFTEFETPLVGTRGLASWAELETPSPAGPTPSRGVVSWVEFETPLTPTRGWVSWAEFETTTVQTRGLVSVTEFEVLDPPTPTRGLVGWLVLDAPSPVSRGRVSWCELSVPAPGDVIKLRLGTGDTEVLCEGLSKKGRLYRIEGDWIVVYEPMAGSVPKIYKEASRERKDPKVAYPKVRFEG